MVSSPVTSYPVLTGNVKDHKYRIERDTFGELQVPADRYWGAQTQRYVQSFIV